MSKRARPGPNQDRWRHIPLSVGLRRNSPRRSGAWAWLLGVAMLGCSSSPTTVRLEVYSWWDTRREQLAFELVANLHRSLHPNVEVVNRADPAVKTRSDVAEIVLAGAPPATFQANLGADLLRWTAVDIQSSGARDKNRLYGLSRLFQSTGLLGALEPGLLDGLRAGDGAVGDSNMPYAIPINIHRLNLLYYNATQLAQWSPPTGYDSWLDPDVLCPTDPLATPLPFRIAIGTGQPFTLTLFVFENLLPALAGAAFYEQLFRGEMSTVDEAWKDKVRRALRCAQFLGQTVDQTAGWETAVKAVADGTAAMTIMGDWAGGELASAEPRAGVTIHAVPFPGSGEIYVYTSDTFPLPVEAEHLAEAEALLETIASPNAQKIFSEEKGSIPARTDVTLDEVGEERRKDYRKSTRALATSGFFPPYYRQDDLNDKLKELIETLPGSKIGEEKLEAVVEELVALQPLFLRWQDRLRQGPLDRPMP